jgi:SAM-dependent methyltransferase
MTSCRICSSNSVKQAFAFKNHSIVHHLKKNHSSSDSYTASLELYECLNCGFLFAEDYFAPASVLYDNYITLSGQKAQIHAQRVVDTISYFINTPTPRIFEIGCNDGSFIKLLSNAGYERIDAVEPAKDAYLQARNVTDNVLNDFFSVNLVEKQLGAYSYDIVVTRQVLEHISDLHDFLEGIKRILVANGLLVIEIPDHSMNYHFCDYSFWEEHINYLTLNTLRQLLAFHGFSIFYYETAIFSGQALIVYCKLNTTKKQENFFDYDLELRSNYIHSFPEFKSGFQNKTNRARTRKSVS